MNEINKSIIEEFYNNIISYPNSCSEVRIFNAKVDRSNWVVRCQDPFTVSGWFTDSSNLICELSRIHNCSVYITVNPVSLGRRPIRARNTLHVLRKGEFATDQDIAVIRYLIVDIDPIEKEKKSRKVNSTDAELQACIDTRDRIVDGLGLSDHCLSGTSGNGTFILISLPELDNDNSSKSKISSLVNHIYSNFSNDSCKIDINTKNPSRLIAIPGTVKYRDIISTPERPHRRVEVHRPGPIHAPTPDSVRP